MRLIAFLLLAASLAPAALAADLPAKPIPAKAGAAAAPGTPAAAQLAAAREAIARGDLAAAETALREASRAEGFEGLPAEQQQWLLLGAGELALRRGDAGIAHGDLRRATARPDAGFEAWQLRAIAALWMDWRDDAAGALATAVGRWPERASELDVHVLGEVVFRTRPAPAGTDDLLEALFAAGYEDPLIGDASPYWHALSLRRAEAGDLAGAREAFARVGDPMTLARAAADRRFDAILPERPTPEAVLAMARRREADLRARALLDPDVIEIQAELARAMMVLGAHEDVIALADEVAAQVAAAPKSYVDADEHLAWLYDSAARAAMRLGRTDEGLARFERASRQRELGSDNTSQVLNLASALAAAGRTREATATVARVGRMSGFGRMALVEVQHQVAVLEKDAAAEAVAMAYLAEHRDDGPAVHEDALLRTGRLDEAAASLVARLDDPDERAQALDGLQRFRTGPVLPGDAQTEANRGRLLAREDVRAAVGRHGRVLEWPVYRPY